MVFRDPELVRHFRSKFNPEVFSQNMKNAALPSWKMMKDDVKESLQTCPTHAKTLRSTCMVCALQTCCESNYVEKNRATDKRGYAPYIEKQRKLVPDFLVVCPMDKAIQVPLLACDEFRRHFHHGSFFQGGRYWELFRFSLQLMSLSNRCALQAEARSIYLCDVPVVHCATLPDPHAWKPLASHLLKETMMPECPCDYLQQHHVVVQNNVSQLVLCHPWQPGLLLSPVPTYLMKVKQDPKWCVALSR